MTKIWFLGAILGLVETLGGTLTTKKSEVKAGLLNRPKLCVSDNGEQGICKANDVSCFYHKGRIVGECGKGGVCCAKDRKPIFGPRRERKIEKRTGTVQENEIVGEEVLHHRTRRTTMAFMFGKSREICTPAVGGTKLTGVCLSSEAECLHTYEGFYGGKDSLRPCYCCFAPLSGTWDNEISKCFGGVKFSEAHNCGATDKGLTARGKYVIGKITCQDLFKGIVIGQGNEQMYCCATRKTIPAGFHVGPTSDHVLRILSKPITSSHDLCVHKDSNSIGIYVESISKCGLKGGVVIIHTSGKEFDTICCSEPKYINLAAITGPQHRPVSSTNRKATVKSAEIRRLPRNCKKTSLKGSALSGSCLETYEHCVRNGGFFGGTERHWDNFVCNCCFQPALGTVKIGSMNTMFHMDELCTIKDSRGKTASGGCMANPWMCTKQGGVYIGYESKNDCYCCTTTDKIPYGFTIVVYTAGQQSIEMFGGKYPIGNQTPKTCIDVRSHTYGICRSVKDDCFKNKGLSLWSAHGCECCADMDYVWLNGKARPAKPIVSPKPNIPTVPTTTTARPIPPGVVTCEKTNNVEITTCSKIAGYKGQRKKNCRFDFIDIPNVCGIELYITSMLTWNCNDKIGDRVDLVKQEEGKEPVKIQLCKSTYLTGSSAKLKHTHNVKFWLEYAGNFDFSLSAAFLCCDGRKDWDCCNNAKAEPGAVTCDQTNKLELSTCSRIFGYKGQQKNCRFDFIDAQKVCGIAVTLNSPLNENCNQQIGEGVWLLKQEQRGQPVAINLCNGSYTKGDMATLTHSHHVKFWLKVVGDFAFDLSANFLCCDGIKTEDCCAIYDCKHSPEIKDCRTIFIQKEFGLDYCSYKFARVMGHTCGVRFTAMIDSNCGSEGSMSFYGSPDGALVDLCEIKQGKTVTLPYDPRADYITLLMEEPLRFQFKIEQLCCDGYPNKICCRSAVPQRAITT